MNSKLKRDLLVVGLVIVTILAIAGCIVLGGYVSPLILLVVYIVGFNFVLLPLFTNMYYEMYGSQSPGWKSFIPLYNATLSTKSSFAVASYIMILVNVVVVLLVMNTWIFEPLGDRMFFIISDGLPLVLMITVSLYYLVAGLSLSVPLLQCKDLYIEFFRDSDDVRTGFARLLMKSGTLTKYLEVLILILPIFRIVPLYIGFNRALELKNFNVSFLDFE